MRKTFLFVSLLAAATPALAGPAYRARGFLRTGYSEKVLAPDQWQIRGTGREAGKSVSVALYRAAELASQAGASELRVTQQHIKSQALVERRTGYQRSYHETADVTVRAVRSAADRVACDMPDTAKCMTLPVAGILATYGPKLDMAAALPGMAPAAPLRIVTANTKYQQAVSDFLKRNPRMIEAPRPVVAPSIAPAAPPPARTVTYVMPAGPVSVPRAQVTTAEAYAALLRAQQPITSGPGWKLRD